MDSDHAEGGAEYFLCVAYDLDRGLQVRTNWKAGLHIVLKCLHHWPKIRHSGAKFYNGRNKTPSTEYPVPSYSVIHTDSAPEYNDHLESHLIHVHQHEYEAKFRD